jgi:hypothetical protein
MRFLCVRQATFPPNTPKTKNSLTLQNLYARFDGNRFWANLGTRTWRPDAPSLSRIRLPIIRAAAARCIKMKE